VGRDDCYFNFPAQFINTATGGGCVVGHGLESCTEDITITKFQRLERSDLDIVFVDSPGLDNANKSDAEILDMIADWLKTTCVGCSSE
jgi:hypothetical protein